MSREEAALEIAAEISAFIRRVAGDAPTFNRLALKLFAYQYKYNFPYRRFCEARGSAPDSVQSWHDIPAAPAAAFKRFALTCAPEGLCLPENGGRTFHSSGTTQIETSRHFMDAVSLNLYRESLKAGYARFVPPTSGIVALMPPPDLAPNSSLSYMLGSFHSPLFLWRSQNWIAGLASWMRSQRKPYTLFGTAFAFVHFFDHVHEQFRIPEDSVIVETGGFKGKSRELSREDLYSLFADRLGVTPARCLSEYGMSEMASQFYDSTFVDFQTGRSRRPRKLAPHWVKTKVIDPITNRDAEHGAPGLLVHFDLANLNSVLAIQTEDYGIGAEDGDGFYLLGRAPGAIQRGCSLTAEEMFAPRPGSPITATV